jgi:hypothetical protein
LEKSERHNLDCGCSGTADSQSEADHHGAVTERDKRTSDDERTAEIEKCRAVAEAIASLAGDENHEERGDAG